MSRAPAKITQADIIRAIKAADRLGKDCEVEIKRDGSTIIRFVPQSTGPVEIRERDIVL